jgi:hypothetical protein
LTAHFDNRIAHYVARVADALDEALPPATQAPKRLHDAMVKKRSMHPRPRLN